MAEVGQKGMNYDASLHAPASYYFGACFDTLRAIRRGRSANRIQFVATNHMY